ncbi:MAG: hypothetical protein ACPIOQ_20485 [Promethearchaeia archaeon]
MPDLLTAGPPSRRRVASLSLGPSDPRRARSGSSESARNQDGCEAEPGTCWGMLRANHFVHDHEQGVRSAPRGNASQLAPEIGQNQGRTEMCCFR